MPVDVLLIAAAIVGAGMAAIVWQRRTREIAGTLARRARTAATVVIMVVWVYVIWTLTHPPMPGR